MPTETQTQNQSPWYADKKFADNIATLRKSVLSPKEGRPVLTVIARQRFGDAEYLVATDTHRLTVVSKDAKVESLPHIDVDPDDSVFLNPKTLEVDPDVDPALKYPHWRRVVPKEHTRSVALNTYCLAAALQALAPIARQDAYRVRLKFSGGLCTVSTKCDALHGTEMMAQAQITYKEGENVDGFEIAVNYEYLLDALGPSALKLTNSNYRTSELRFTESTRSFTVRQQNDDTCMSVIMPMALA